MSCLAWKVTRRARRISISVRFTCTADRASVSASSLCVSGRSQRFSWVSPNRLQAQEDFAEEMGHPFEGRTVSYVYDPLAGDCLLDQS